MTNNVQLCEALNEIVVDNIDCCNWEDFKDDIAERMSGWTIETWDADKYGTHLTGNILSYIQDEQEEGRDEFQYAEWCTEVNDLYVFVIATRKGGDNDNPAN